MRAAVVTVLWAFFVTGCLSAEGQSGRSTTNSDQQTTEGVDGRLAATLQNILDENRELFAAGAASAAVVIPGQGTWLGASGVANPKTREPVTTDTVFALGSVTKTFLTALVLKLSEEGVLGLAPIPGPFDEAVLLIAAVPLFVFYRQHLAEAWERGEQDQSVGAGP